MIKPVNVSGQRTSPDLGVFAVDAASVLCAFPARWTHYLNSVSAAGPVQVPLSLPLTCIGWAPQAVWVELLGTGGLVAGVRHYAPYPR